MKKIILNIIIICLIAIIGLSGYKLFNIYKQYSEAKNTYIDLKNEVKYEIKDKKEENNKEEINIDWKKLQKINPDVIGWIYCENTNIDYPILQGKDNDYYLYRLYTHDYSISGSIFADYNSINPFSTDLTILYGHRTRNMSMFATLKYYFWEEFYLSHPEMKIYTPEKNYTLQLFSAKEVVGGSVDYYKYNFIDEKDKKEYIDRITTNNEMLGYDNRVNINIQDKLVMLSTCTSRGSDVDINRLAIWGRLVEDNYM